MASLLYWKGGTGRMGNPANWEGPEVGPDGQRPAAGDQCIIRGGSVFAAGPGWSGVNVTLNGLGASDPPSLTLQGGIIGTLTVNARQYSALTSSYGHLEIQGRSAVASGTRLGGAGAAPVTLDMHIADNSAFVNIAPLTVQNGSSLSVTRDAAPGFHGVSFENHSTVEVSGGAHAVFGTRITAGGTMRVAAAPANGSDTPAPTDGGHIEFKGSVAATQSIDITQGTVQVDQPMLFAGAVTLGAAPGAGSGTLAGASLSLESLHAATAELTAAGLFLRGTAGNLLADIHLAAPAGGAVYVANQADGSVSLTGYALPGASEIHLSTAPVPLA